MIEMKNVWNMALLAALWVTSIVALGLVARAMVWLFCLGYGC